ncbi:MAG: hypothetical protein JSS99_11075 [Actinobacteria bacterium]|nr:hypothetical protein [Actinomycetota bacterium]
MKARITTLTALALAGLALGCGSSDDKAEEAEHSATPQQAIAEIGKVRSGLAQALATYEAGDAGAADRQVGDTYLQHFELVEGPLGQADHELNEQLEDTIREQLRARIRADAGAAKVRALVRAIDAKLDAAERALAHQ